MLIHDQIQFNGESWQIQIRRRHRRVRGQLIRKRSHFTLFFAILSLTAQSGEESILVASLRGVIAKQAAEIETLQNKLKELTVMSVAAAETATSEASQSTAKFAEVRYIFHGRFI
jgi:hypothetical protein